MATSVSAQNVSVIDDRRRAQNRLAQRRRRQKKALEKQAALEHNLATHTEMQAAFQDWAGLPMSAGTTDLNSIGSFSLFPGSDLAIGGEGFPPQDDSIFTLTGSRVSASTSSDLLPPADLMPPPSSRNLETNEAVGLGTSPYRRTTACRSNLVFSNNRNETLIHTAARGNDLATLQLLVQYGFPVTDRDNEGRTALHAAYEEYCTEAILWLLEHGVDVNAVDNQAVRLFLSYGASWLPKHTEQLRD